MNWHPISEIPPIDTTRSRCRSRFVMLWGQCTIGQPRDVPIVFTGYYDHELTAWQWLGNGVYGDFQPTRWCDLLTPLETT